MRTPPRIHPLFLILLVVVLFFFGRTAGDFFLDRDRGAPAIIEGAIDRIVDGDTLEVAGWRVRLWGVDAARGKATTESARMVLDELVGDRELECEVQAWQEPTQRYPVGRAIARCLVDDQDLAVALLDAGVVVENRRYSKGYYGVE